MGITCPGKGDGNARRIVLVKPITNAGMKWSGFVSLNKIKTNYK